jgi:uracil-DNA glycosylase family 4
MLDSITPSVFGEGPRITSIALVGEAPGYSEAKLRRPFIGRAGELLTKLLHASNISRSDIYITNVIKQRPGSDDNDLSEWFRQKGASVWTSPGYNAYVELLKKELLAIDGLNVIIPVGNAALYALTEKTQIMKRRGSILPCTLIPHIKCIPTIHPAAALREYMFTHYIKHDLTRAIEESKTRDLNYTERTIHIEPSYNDCLEFLAKVSASPVIATDIEVMNEEISCISISISPTHGISIPFVKDMRDYFTPEQELTIWATMAEIFSNPSIKKIGQNFIFDMSFIFRKYGIIINNYECTMIGQGIAYPDFPKGLDFITSIYTREPYYKDEGKKWFRTGGSYSDFWLYNAKDSLVCQEAFPHIMLRIDKQENNETYKCQRDLIHPLMYMQTRGMKVNTDGLALASVEAEKKIAELTTKLHEICGYELNHNSPKQLIDYFYTRKGLTPYYNKGSVTTNDDALKRLVRKGIKEALIIRDLRKVNKLKSTYYDMKMSADGRLRSAMNPIGTVSGRLASSQDIFGEGGNVQNLPLLMQQYILADDGYVMYIPDLSQAENRTTANIAPEPLMLEAFEKGIDIHSMTGGMISSLDMDEIKHQDKESIFCSLGTGEYTWRFWGKKCNHSLNYDLGYKSFALRFEMPEIQAKMLVDRFHKVYPGIRQYHAWVRAQLMENATLTNCYGRKRVFLNRWGDELFKEAYSWIPQSSIADKVNRQGILFIWNNQQWFKYLELLNQIHDSLVFQIPIAIGWDKHAEMLLRLRDSLESPMVWHGKEFTIPLEFKFGYTMKDTKKVGLDNDETVGRLANKLYEVYRELGTAKQLPSVDWDISNSSGLTEEV